MARPARNTSRRPKAHKTSPWLWGGLGASVLLLLVCFATGLISLPTSPTGSQSPASVISSLLSSVFPQQPSTIPGTVVTSTSELATALANTKGGDTIVLAPGTYTRVIINGKQFTNPVTIASQYPKNPATIAYLDVTKSSGLAFSNIILTGSSDSYAQARVSNAQNITFNGMDVHGSLSAAPGSQLNGFYVSASSEITITHSKFHNLNGGIVQNVSNSLTDTDNSFYSLSKGGIEMGGIANATIKDNIFANFQVAKGTHSDGIQVYESTAYGSSSNLTIDDNLMARGSGIAFQGILLGNEIHQPLHNVEISGNAILGGNWNSIALSQGSGNVTISNNVIGSWSGYDNVANTTVNYIGWIRLGNLTMANLALTNNTAQSYLDSTNKPYTPGGSNRVIGAVTDSGSALLRAWANSHESILADMDTDLLSQLGVSVPSTPSIPVAPSPTPKPAPTPIPVPVSTSTKPIATPPSTPTPSTTPGGSPGLFKSGGSSSGAVFTQ